MGFSFLDLPTDESTCWNLYHIFLFTIKISSFLLVIICPLQSVSVNQVTKAPWKCPYNCLGKYVPAIMSQTIWPKWFICSGLYLTFSWQIIVLWSSGLATYLNLNVQISYWVQQTFVSPTAVVNLCMYVCITLIPVSMYHVNPYMYVSR